MNECLKLESGEDVVNDRFWVTGLSESAKVAASLSMTAVSHIDVVSGSLR